MAQMTTYKNLTVLFEGAIRLYQDDDQGRGLAVPPSPSRRQSPIYPLYENDKL